MYLILGGMNKKILRTHAELMTDYLQAYDTVIILGKGSAGRRTIPKSALVAYYDGWILYGRRPKKPRGA